MQRNTYCFFMALALVGGIVLSACAPQPEVGTRPPQETSRSRVSDGSLLPSTPAPKKRETAPSQTDTPLPTQPSTPTPALVPMHPSPTPTPLPEQPKEKPWTLPPPSCTKQDLGKGFQIGAVETEGAEEKAIRVTRYVLNWSDAEPQEGVWNRAYIEEIARLADSESCRGRTVMMVVISTPAWAVRKGTVGSGVPQNLDLPPDHPKNYWGRFGKEVSRLFKSRVDHWIVWNEPDVKVTDGGHFWDGTAEEYVILHRTAYFAIREGNPNAKIHLASISQWYTEKYFEDILRALTADPEAPAHGYYFDYVSLNNFNAVNHYIWIVHRIKQIMHARDIDKPIWIMEANFVDPPFSEDIQAAWLVETAALVLAAGGDGFMIYRWKKEETSPYSIVFGIEHKLAAHALRTAAKYLTGEYASAELTITAVWEVTINRPNERVRIIWNFTDTPIAHTLSLMPSGSVRVINKYDEEIPVSRIGDTLQILLAPARAFVRGSGYWVGGDPVIIVETYGEENVAPLAE